MATRTERWRELDVLRARYRAVSDEFLVPVSLGHLVVSASRRTVFRWAAEGHVRVVVADRVRMVRAGDLREYANRTM